MVAFADDVSVVDRGWLESFTPAAGGSKLPDDAVVLGYHALVSFIDAETGQNRWFVHSWIDVSVTQLIGMLELAKLQLVATTPGAPIVPAKPNGLPPGLAVPLSGQEAARHGHATHHFK